MKLPIVLFFTVFFITFFLLVIFSSFFLSHHTFLFGTSYWRIKSIDTMKYSRDLAREKINDKNFDAIIDIQVANIAKTGANYVAIGTPYDEEFTPILRRWVASARKYHLHVWFRGNFSGWEKWFGYDEIDRATHIAKTKQFILQNQDLFVDGDIFSSCPECENGADIAFGDDAQVKNYRQFLIQEYQTTKDTFKQIHKDVQSNYFSMNGDVARLVMDKPTTAALDGIVVVDHYVASPSVLADDLRQLALSSGGNVVLGEFGSPIPDIHGQMTDREQKEWLEQALTEIKAIPQVVGINYWVNMGGSTALWTEKNHAKPAVSILTTFYSSNSFFSIHPPPSP